LLAELQARIQDCLLEARRSRYQSRRMGAR